MVRTIKKHNKDKNKKTRRRYKQKTFKKRDRYRNNRKRKTYHNNRKIKTYRNNRKRKTYRNNRKRKTYSNNRKIKTYRKYNKRYVSKLFKLYKGGSLPWSSDLQVLTKDDTLTNICRRPDNSGKSLVFIYNNINHIMVKYVNGILPDLTKGKKDGRPDVHPDMLPIEVKRYWRPDTDRSQVYPYRELSKWRRSRHHCRVCGRVIGDNSMKKNFQLLDGTNIEKICFECYAVLYKEREEEQFRRDHRTSDPGESGSGAPGPEPEPFRCVNGKICRQLSVDNTDLPKCIKKGRDYFCPGQIGIYSQGDGTSADGLGMPAESSVDTGFKFSELPNEISYRSSDSRTWVDKTHMETFGSRTKLDLSPLILPGLIIKQSNKGYIILSIDDSYWYVLCIHSDESTEIGIVDQLNTDNEFNQTYLYRPCWNHVRVLHGCFKYDNNIGGTVKVNREDRQRYIVDPSSFLKTLELDSEIVKNIAAAYQQHLARKSKEESDLAEDVTTFIEGIMADPVKTIKSYYGKIEKELTETPAPAPRGPTGLDKFLVEFTSGHSYRDELDKQANTYYGITITECIEEHTKYVEYLINIQVNLWIAFCCLLPMITNSIDVEILGVDGLRHESIPKERLVVRLDRMVKVIPTSARILSWLETLAEKFINKRVQPDEPLLHLRCTIGGYRLEFNFLLYYIQSNKSKCLGLIEFGLKKDEGGMVKDMIR